jgi:hypothetical protein
MTTTPASNSTHPFAALDAIEIISSNTEMTLSERILEAYSVAQAYTTQLVDPEFRRNAEERLGRSNVRGSKVTGVRGSDDVAKMLSAASGWKEIVANLKDKEITVLQGELPGDYEAFAAYASVREIFTTFEAQGLDVVAIKKGFQKIDEFYLATMLRFPTNILTVQLKKDASGVEQLHQWFAGRELSSYLIQDAGDIPVRCGSVIQPVTQRQNHKSNARTYRRSGTH